MSVVMIYFIWTLWLLNLIFMTVIMLNLLISIMTQCYDAASSEASTLKYKFRIQMASDAAVIKETLLMMIGRTYRAKVFHLAFSVLQEEEDEANSQSISKQVQTFVAKESKDIKEKLNQMNASF